MTTEILYADGINPIEGWESVRIWGQQPVGYRGVVAYDAGVVHTPYIPLTVTRTPVVPSIRRIGADGRIEEQIDGVWTTRSKTFKTETDAYLDRIGYG